MLINDLNPAADQPGPPPADGRWLPFPQDENDLESYERIYQALGRPERAEGYELAGLFEGQELDDGIMSAMSRAMHEAGLTKAQARKLAAAYQSLWLTGLEDEARRYQAELAEVRDRLPAATREMARRGFRMLRLPPEEARRVAENLERSLGPGQAVEIFARLGAASAEDRPVAGGAGDGFDGGPEAAMHRINRRFADQDFKRRYFGGEARAIEEIAELYRLSAQKSA